MYIETGTWLCIIENIPCCDDLDNPLSFARTVIMLKV